MLETVVSDEGTARAAALPGVRVAGKTGTAQKWDAATGTYSQTQFRAWFIGVAPADDPRIVIVSELDEPKHPLHTGGAAAAPLFAQVAPGQLAHRGIFLRREEMQVAQARRAARAREPPRRRERAAGRERGARAASFAQRAAASEATVRRERGWLRARAAPPARRRRLSAFRDRVLLPDFTGLSKSEVTPGHGEERPARETRRRRASPCARIRRPAAWSWRGARSCESSSALRSRAEQPRSRRRAEVAADAARGAARRAARAQRADPARGRIGGRQSRDPRTRLRLARGRTGRRVLRAARRRDRRARLSPRRRSSSAPRR